ncbi:T9SS type A sorting domain-containing protein [Larkinella arboricola]
MKHFFTVWLLFAASFCASAQIPYSSPVSFTTAGVYNVRIPFEGYEGDSYLVTITAKGGDGGGQVGDYNHKGGNGATVQTTFRIRAQPEGQFTIVVGQAGGTWYMYGGGGGGSAVSVEEYFGNRSLLVVAGGGGGSSYEYSGGGGQGLGPSSGGRGGTFDDPQNSEGGGGGGGLDGPGVMGNYSPRPHEGKPWLAGGGGGQARSEEISAGGYSYENRANGGAGFGGGGGSGLSGNSGGGGGGGYGGGRGGGYPTSSSGGYSYVNPSGTMTTITPGSTSGTQYQDGSVTIAFYKLDATAITNFDIINADTDQVLAPLEEEGTEGREVNLAAFSTRKLNIQANFKTTPPGSVVFELSGQQSRTHIENSAPFALFEDNNGDFKNWTPAPGSYTLMATPYSGPNGTGTAGAPYKVSFTVIDLISIDNFSLVEATWGSTLRTMSDGSVLDLASTSSPSYNIRANTIPNAGVSSIGSVVFQLSGAQTLTQIENEAPYALFKDDGGKYRSWTPKVGSYTLMATPYSGPNGTGKAHISKTIHFQVIRSSPPARLAADAETESGLVRVFPNPFTESFTIESKGAQTGPQAVELYDLLGRKVWQGVTTGDKQVVPVGSQLGAGAYILRVGQGAKTQNIKMLKIP